MEEFVSAEVSETTLAAFATTGRSRRFGRNSVICRGGDPIGSVMLVAWGRIDRLVRIDDLDVGAGSIGVGSLIGAAASVDGFVHSATLIAATDVMLHEIDPLKFSDMLESSPTVALDVLRSVVARFRREPAASSALSPDALRVGRVLVDHLARGGAPWGVLDRWRPAPAELMASLDEDARALPELAAETGFDADRVAAALGELDRACLVCVEAGRIAVEDRETLQRLCLMSVEAPVPVSASWRKGAQLPEWLRLGKDRPPESSAGGLFDDPVALHSGRY